MWTGMHANTRAQIRTHARTEAHSHARTRARTHIQVGLLLLGAQGMEKGSLLSAVVLFALMIFRCARPNTHMMLQRAPTRAAACTCPAHPRCAHTWM
jgi:hypothetical protein